MLIRSFVLKVLLIFLAGCASVKKSSPMLILTFDDFPCLRESDTKVQCEINEKILNTLKKHKAKAFVFVNAGGMVRDSEKKENILRLWRQNGHKVGNHTFSHPFLSKISAFEYEMDITKGEPILKKILAEDNQSLTYFRYPYLDSGRDSQKSRIKEFLKRKGYEVVWVTVDTLDWQYNAKMYHGEDGVVANYLKHVKEVLKSNFGKQKTDIALFHVSLITAKCLDEILMYAKTLGYELDFPWDNFCQIC